ncbi:MAG TPA: chemotaxis protein CheA [Kaistia sp.]|nr:chemotaxis protein CheA [Kaistia sp.]
MDDLLAQFVIEAAELTQQAAEDLLALEREPGDRARLDSAFRAIHTLKGSVGLFDLAPMQSALHAAEDVLGLAKKEDAELDPSRIDPMFAVVEWVDRCVRDLEQTGSLGAKAQEESAELVRALGSKTPSSASASPPSLTSGPVPPWAASLFEAHPTGQGVDAVAFRYAPTPQCFFNGDDPVTMLAAVPQIVFARILTRDEWPAPTEMDPFRSNLIFEAISTAKRADIEAVFRLIPDQIAIVQARLAAQPAPPPEPVEPSARTIRVDLARIDDIVTLVGEVLAAKNGMSALVAEAQALAGGLPLSRNIATAQQDLTRLINRLQRATTDVRMVPLGDTLRRLPRLAREISGQTGKPLQLDVSGSEIEADKSIVDGLYEPLLHMLRNAVDHGIETEEQRRIAGKPAKGRISVTARQVGHGIELQVADDGRGIEPEQIRATALARGLIPLEAAESLDGTDILDLLFAPGFSTSESVTDLSGRGVGMDAVRTAVRRLGGKVAIASTVGAGTTITLSLPTGFSMSRILVVSSSGEAYGIPLEAVAETLRIPSGAIVKVRAGEAYVLRNRTLPVLRLGDILGTPTPPRPNELMLVLELGATVVGLVVDSIGERFETLLRPPSGLLKHANSILGTAVVGDGRIVIVLNLEALLS